MFRHICKYIFRVEWLFVAIIIPISAGIRFTANFPRADDFNSCLEFLQRFAEEVSWTGKLRVLFTPHNEHFIVFTRVVVLIDYWVFQSLNFIHLTLFGLFGLALLFFLLLRDFSDRRMNVTAERSRQIAWIYFCGANLILFQLQYYDVLNWPMASLNTFWVMVFAYLAVRAGTRRMFSANFSALGWGVAATLTQGNGLFTFPVLGLVAFFSGGRRWLVWFWVGITGLVITAFLLMSSRTAVPSVVSTSAMVDHVLRFLGVGLGLGSGTLCRLAGAVFVVSAVWFSYCLIPKRGNGKIERRTDLRMNQRTELLLGMVWFVLVSAVANSILRQGVTFQNAPPELTPRYAFPSLFGFAALLLLLPEVFECQSPGCWSRQLKLGCFLALAALSLNLFSLVRNLPLLKRSYQLTQLSALSWQLTGGGLLYPAPGMAAEILQKSIRLGHFLPSEQVFADWVSTPSETSPPLEREGKLPLQLDYLGTGEEYLVVNGWIYRPWNYDPQARATVLLERRTALSTERFSFSTRRTLQVSGDGKPFAVATDPTGFFALIPTKNLPVGDYEVKILLSKPAQSLVASDRKATLVSTGRTVNLSVENGCSSAGKELLRN